MLKSEVLTNMTTWTVIRDYEQFNMTSALSNIETSFKTREKARVFKKEVNKRKDDKTKANLYKTTTTYVNGKIFSKIYQRTR